jgi:hypothetical protein
MDDGDAMKHKTDIINIINTIRQLLPDIKGVYILKSYPDIEKKSYHIIFDGIHFPKAKSIQVYLEEQIKPKFRELFEKKIITNVFEMGFADADSFPFKKGFLVNSYIDRLGLKEHKIVNGISVNLISDNESYFQQLQSKYNADIESMEGAALHYVCLQEQVPFIQIRGISNYTGERDKSKWKIKEAVESSNFLASDIIQAVQQKKQQ